MSEISCVSSVQWIMGNVVFGWYVTVCVVWKSMCERTTSGGEWTEVHGQDSWHSPPPKERLPDAPIQSRRAMERRRSRGRDGGPGPRGSGVAGDQGRAGSQGRDEGTGAHQGWADGTGAHQGGADGTGAHQGGADGTEDLHGGADDHQTGTDGAEDHLGGTDGPEDHGRDWDLGNTETHETNRAFLAPRAKAGNTKSS